MCIRDSFGRLGGIVPDPDEIVTALEEKIIKPENLVYKKPTLMNDNAMHYCQGCSHGVVHKLIAEVIEEMGMEDKTCLLYTSRCV